VKIPFVGPSYEARSLNADAQRTLNAYLEMDNAIPRAPVALYGTPGLVWEFLSNDTPQRGCIAQGDYVYLVAGQYVFRLTIAAGVWSAYTMGTIGTNSGPVGLASNGTQVLIVDGTGGWLAENTTLTSITDPGFPVGVTQADCLDGFFVVTGDGSAKFYWCELPNEGADWNGLDFASAEGAPDNTVTCRALQNQLWLFGAYSAEPWVRSGGDAVFTADTSAFINVGTASAETVKLMDNTIFWLASSLDGAGIVYRLAGYTPQRISTHAVEKAIQSYTLTDAYAITYEQEGHAFYVLTFPTDEKTWVYDAATQQWHERASTEWGTNTDKRWRPVWHVYFKSLHLVGDYETGNVFSLDLDAYTEERTDGVHSAIRRLRTTQCIDAPNGERVFYQSMQVDMETGVGLATGQGSAPLLMLRYSDDGGHTWSNERTVSVGAVGEYGARAIFRRLGMGRNRVWSVSMTDPVKFAILGAYSSFEKGAS
jgi:hypothetical protein